MNADVVADALRALWASSTVMATSPAAPMNSVAARHQLGEEARSAVALERCAGQMLRHHQGVSSGKVSDAVPLNAIAIRNHAREKARMSAMTMACAGDLSRAAVLPPSIDAEYGTGARHKCIQIAALLSQPVPLR